MFVPDYDYTIGTFAMICERCAILLTLMKCGKIKSCDGCSAVHSDMTAIQWCTYELLYVYTHACYYVYIPTIAVNSIE